jgi:hypothetical protein
MADKAELTIVITQDGQVRIETHGLVGESCMTETESIERALGTVVEREKTGEYYKRSTQDTTKVRRG